VDCGSKLERPNVDLESGLTDAHSEIRHAGQIHNLRVDCRSSACAASPCSRGDCPPVLDLSMPVMNGLDAAQVLRRLMPAVPLIMYSAFGDRYAEQQAFFDSGVGALLL